MAKNADITFEVLNIQTEGQMVSAVIQLREYYEFEKLPQPPLPANVIKLAPCDLQITETLGASELKTGKVLITSPSGKTLYEKEWLLNP